MALNVCQACKEIFRFLPNSSTRTFGVPAKGIEVYLLLQIAKKTAGHKVEIEAK